VRAGEVLNRHSGRSEESPCGYKKTPGWRGWRFFTPLRSVQNDMAFLPLRAGLRPTIRTVKRAQTAGSQTRLEQRSKGSVQNCRIRFSLERESVTHRKKLSKRSV
jgi:hypothetical protein